MNDNTIIRIKVPARLYESVKAKLMIKEEAPVQETKVEESEVEETQSLEESPIVDILTGLAGAAGLGLTGAAIVKAQDWLKDKNPELYKKLQSMSGGIEKAKGWSNEESKVSVNEAKDSKKADDKKKAEEKKKKEAEAKKVADKKAADKKKEAEKKK